jgi:hypothetical protein
MRDFERAANAIARLDLKGPNKEVAAHWLSRWRDDKPPLRRNFDATQIARHGPAIAIFEIKRGEAIPCIAAGAFCRLALGYDLTGHDLLSVTDLAERDARLAWCWQLVQGAVTVSYRSFKSEGRSAANAQGVSLPFSDIKADGSRYFLMHTNWRPVGDDWIDGHVTADAPVPVSRQIISFMQSSDVSSPVRRLA